QVLAHARALAGRRGEFNELEPVDPHRVLESGDLHAEVGLGAHGDSGGMASKSVDGTYGRQRPHRRVIVSHETIGKARRNMNDPCHGNPPRDRDDGGARLAAGARHVELDLEHFLPYRLSVLSNRVSDSIFRMYSERFEI